MKLLSLLTIPFVLSAAAKDQTTNNNNKDKTPNDNNGDKEAGSGNSDVNGETNVSGTWGNQGKGNDSTNGNAGGSNGNLKTAPGGGGDPHFRTYDGTQYSYHGECDLVMARSASFGDNLGLDLHIRTASMGSWSLISNAALRVGDDIYEFANDGSHYVNGHPVALPYDIAGKYTITSKVIEFKNAEDESVERQVVNINLGDGDEIRMTLVKGMIYVRASVYLEGTEGMLGVHGVAGMVGRDGKALDDTDDMGSSWQVRDTEAMLFHEVRFPQYPQKCTPPTVDARRRLARQSKEDLERAEKACASVDDFSRHFCVEDVLLTGDVSVADTYAFGEAF